MKKYICLAVMAMVIPFAHADFVNGSFETGDFTGWDVTNAPRGSFLFVYEGGDDGLAPSDGNYVAAFGAVAQENDTISQTLSTVKGEQYIFSFDVASSGPTEPFENFEVQWDGQDLYNDNAPPNTYGDQLTHMYFTVTGTGSDVASLGAYNLFSNTVLDNVHLTPAVTPEPATYVILAAGGLLLALRARRS